MTATMEITPDVVPDTVPDETAESRVPASLAEALAIFQADLPHIPRTKDGQSGHRTFMYADLSLIVRTCSPILTKLGLAIVSGTQVRDGRTILVSKLVHVPTGEYETSEIEVTSRPGNMQPLGANITYARRYNYAALIGIVTDEDTDMEGTEVAEPVNPNAATPEQRESLNQAAREGLPVERLMYDLFGDRVTPANITRAQADALLHAIDTHQG